MQSYQLQYGGHSQDRLLSLSHAPSVRGKTLFHCGAVFVEVMPSNTATMHQCTPPKRPKLEMAIDEKRWENLRDRPIQTIIYHETGD